MNTKENRKEIKIRLNPAEYDRLNENVAKTGLSREAYLRCLVNERIPVEYPPADYGAVLRRLHSLESEMCCITAQPPSNVDTAQLHHVIQLVGYTAMMLQNAMLPQPYRTATHENTEEKLYA